jgi:hypothetical protein
MLTESRLTESRLNRSREHRPKGISLNGAPSQYERWFRSKRADSVKVDARTPTELLSFAVPFGKLLNFYDLENHIDGDWTFFFLTDPTMILACLAAMDLHAVEKRFDDQLAAVRAPGPLEEKRRKLRDSVDSIVPVIGQIDSWLNGALMLPKSRVARLFAAELATWIGDHLSPQLRQLQILAEPGASPGAMAVHRHPDFGRLQGPWNVRPVVVRESDRCDGAPAEQLERAVERLQAVYRAFLEVLLQLQKFGRNFLPDTLQESDHKPQIALYIAFVRLFGTAQRTMNTLTKRFAQFYYREILRETNAAAIPDSVYLTFSLDPAAGAGVATVPAGTQFPAGTEADGTAILYASDRDVSVSAATLSCVRTIRVVPGPLYTRDLSPPEGGDAPGQATQIVLGSEINVRLMNDEAAGKVPAEGLLPWTTFGESATGGSAIVETTPATLGFAIASPYLTLSGGDRAVTLTFQLTAESQQALEAALHDLAEVTGLDPENVFERVLDAAFDIYLSTTDGWFQLKAYSSVAIPAGSPPAPPAFLLAFTLPASAPPVTGYNPPADAPPPSTPPVPDSLNPAPGIPSLKAYLRQTPVTIRGTGASVSIYPLSLIAPFRIAWLDIRTTTENLTDLTTQNTTGAVDTGSPYPVFGGTAVTGSFLQLSNRELFVKKPETGTLAVNLKWFGLPPNQDGFAGYYQYYVLGLNGQPSPTVLFDNQTFRGEITVVNPGTWRLRDAPLPWHDSPPTPGLFLFRTQDSCANPIPAPDGPLCDVSGFDTLDVIDMDPPPYYEPSSSALRLTLTEPAYAFGNVLYASNVLNAVIADLPQVDKGGTFPPGCQPLADAAAGLDSAMQKASGTPPPNYRDRIQDGVRQAQESLIAAARSYLSQIPGRLSPDAAAWIGTAFTTTGSNAPAYRAQVIRGRLQAALQSLGKSGVPISPPGLPESDAAPLRRSSVMLQAVIWMQQCLDQCSPEPSGTYQKCIETQLAACQIKLRQACTDCAPPPAQMNYPNAPWFPQAQALSVSYSASCGFPPSAAGQSCGSYYHLLPFGGYAGASTDSSRPGGAGTPLLSVPAPGNLELGFSGLDAAQSLGLLFQMAAGSGGDPQTVTWQYLVSDTWTDFTVAQVPSDSTNGLQNTGILTLHVPQTETAAPTGYRWLRAVTGGPDDFPDTIGIYPHPSTATWVSNAGGSGGHLSHPLPPYTIASSVQTLAAIKVIDQPIESFGGRPAEDDKAFRMRIAERLRHKDRAILPWDYEQLVLERFPSIWKVKALPATDAKGNSAPGKVLIVVVAGKQSVQVADPTEPLASAGMLEQIRLYLASLASPFAGIQVVNPVYVRVRVFAEVLFQEGQNAGENAGGGIDRLNSDLVQYLSPWFYDAERALRRGDYASEDAISQFIQTRPYVEALITFRTLSDPPPESLAWYFLTSAKEHSLTAADDPSVHSVGAGRGNDEY